ncbi:MAG: hypothetical protein ACLP5H_13115 [Desulfomonilaceae bacterium]
MKTIALVGLILVATVSTGIAADTLMTIQTNTTIRIDPITGLVKGDAQTQVKGIRKHHEAPEAVNTPAGGTASTDTTAATTPVTATTAADPSTSTTPDSVAAPTDPSTAATPVVSAPDTTSSPTCPAVQTTAGQ